MSRPFAILNLKLSLKFQELRACLNIRNVLNDSLQICILWKSLSTVGFGSGMNSIVRQGFEGIAQFTFV